MQKLIFVIGAAAVGKSYFIEQNYGEKDVEILHIHDYQQRAYDEAGFGKTAPLGANFACLKKANELLLKDVIEKLRSGRDVVVEHTLYKAKRRIAYIEEIRKAADVLIEFYVISPSDGQWESNLKKRGLTGDLLSYKNDAVEIEFPNPAEGIDRIYEVTDDRITLKTEPPRPGIVDAAHQELAKEAERLKRDEEEKKKRADLTESMRHRPFWHYCEVCGKKEFMTAEDAFDAGWDYPPDMGRFGMLSPRMCGDCGLEDTLFWKVNSGGSPIVTEGNLSPNELITWERIKAEPESLILEE